MTPTPEEWRRVLQRLEAVERLATELLARVYRLEREVGVKAAPAPTPAPSPPAPMEIPAEIPPPEPVPPPITTPSPVAAAEPTVKPTEPKVAEERPQFVPPSPPPSAPPPVTIAEPTPIPTEAKVAEERPQFVPPSPPSPAPPAQPLAPEPGQPLVDWESLIGGKWALWIGLVLVLLAMVFFMNLVWAAIGPAGRTIVGALSGLAFLAGGEYAKGRTKRWFSEGLSAGGLALLYLTVWVATMRYQLIDIPLAFAAMSAVTATGVVLAVRYDALSLILLSTLGGYLTPVLLHEESAGAPQVSFFFGYVTALNAGILATATYKRWRVMNFVTFFATVVLIGGWWLISYEPRWLWHTFAFLTANFLIFVGISSVYALRFRAVSAPEDLAFFVSVSVAYFLSAAYLLAQPLTGARGVFPLALAAFHGAFGEVVRRRLPEDKGLVFAAYSLAVAFLTIAVPMQFEGNPVAIGWAVEAAALTAIATRVNSAALRDGAVGIWMLAIVTLAWIDLTQPSAAWRPLFNERFLTFAAVIAATIFMTYEHRRQLVAPKEETTPNLLAFVAGGLLLWLIARETTALFEQSNWLAPYQGAAAWLTLLGMWALVAVGLFALSLRTELTALQGLTTLTLLGVVLAIVFIGWETTEAWLPVLNLRLLAALMVIGSLFAIVLTAFQHPEKTEWIPPSLFIVAASLLTIFALSREVYAAFARWRFPSPQEWELAAWFAMTALWGLLGVVFFALGQRWQMVELRWMGVFTCGSGGILAFFLSFATITEKFTPLFNFRVLAFAAFIAASAAFALWFARFKETLTATEREALKPVTFAALANLASLWLLTLEVYNLFRWLQFPSAETWRYAGQLGISVAWALYAAAALWVGIAYRQPFARWLALSLFGLAVLKVFLVDLGFLTLPFRMVSFLVLGLLLIGVAWAYSRYGEQLREWTRGQ